MYRTETYSQTPCTEIGTHHTQTHHGHQAQTYAHTVHKYTHRHRIKIYTVATVHSPCGWLQYSHQVVGYSTFTMWLARVHSPSGWLQYSHHVAGYSTLTTWLATVHSPRGWLGVRCETEAALQALSVFPVGQQSGHPCTHHHHR